MTSDLQPVDSWTSVLVPVGDLAGKIAATDFVPKSLRGKPAAVAAAILAGRERGLPPMVSLAGIDVVDGRPTLNATLLAALVYRAGHKIEVTENSDKVAEVRIERADGLGSATVRWTMTDAQRAGLAGKRNWQTYPRQMLFARALSEAARQACPDVALGLDVDLMEPTPEQGKPVTVQRAPITDQSHQSHGAETFQKGAESPPTAIEAPGVEPEPSEPPSRPTEADDAPDPGSEPTVTPGQMRKLQAIVTGIENATGQRMDRDARRQLIAAAAGIDPPEALGSAKDLTREQAHRAIETLDARPVDNEPGGSDGA